MILSSLPPTPANPALINSHSILERADEAAEALFTAFETVRRARNAKGTATDHEQDLLRAALVLAAAGLDAMVKQLVRDTLGLILTKQEGAQRQFTGFIQSRLRREEQVDIRFLAEALAAERPMMHLRAELVRELTGASLQSVDQLLKVAASFAIPADEITKDPKHLRTVFEARNQIAHEMDILFGQPNRGRRQRARKTMHEYTKLVLSVGKSFYTAVEKRL